MQFLETFLKLCVNWLKYTYIKNKNTASSMTPLAVLSISNIGVISAILGKNNLNQFAYNLGKVACGYSMWLYAIYNRRAAYLAVYILPLLPFQPLHYLTVCQEPPHGPWLWPASDPSTHNLLRAAKCQSGTAVTSSVRSYHWAHALAPSFLQGHCTFQNYLSVPSQLGSAYLKGHLSLPLA